MKIVLSGYYGFHNSGDEAVLLSILTALERAGQKSGVTITPLVLSGDPQVTTRLYGVQAIPRMKWGAVLHAIQNGDGLISGGGSLLQDETSWRTIPYYLAILKLAQWCRKPTFIYAQGIGPIHRTGFYRYIRHTFNRCAYISVRDCQSAHLLTKMGLEQQRIEVVPDPVMGLPAATAVHKEQQALPVDMAGRPIIGVALRFWNKDHSDMDAMVATLQQFGHTRPLHIRFLPFHGQDDRAAARYVMTRLTAHLMEVDDLAAKQTQPTSVMSLCPAYEHPQTMLQEVGRCQLLVGMRLHALIYAVAQQVPVAGISYDPKIDHFLQQLGQQAVGSTQNIHPTTVTAYMNQLLERGAQWRTAHQGAIAALKQAAAQPAQRIVQWLQQQNQT